MCAATAGAAVCNAALCCRLTTRRCQQLPRVLQSSLLARPTDLTTLAVAGRLAAATAAAQQRTADSGQSSCVGVLQALFEVNKLRDLEHM
jgi:hypothetical protein